MVDLFMVVPPGPAAAFVRCHQYRRANGLSRVTAMSVRSNAVRCDHDRHGRPDRGPVRPVGGEEGALDAPVEGALRGGHHLWALHRVCRLRDRVPARRHRLRARAGRVQAVPPRGGARARQLHPRREGLHVVHPGLPSLPQLGAGGRRAPLRPRAPARRAVRHLPGHPPHARERRHGPPDGPGRRARVSAADLGPRPGLHRRRPDVVPRGRTGGRHEQLEGRAGGGHHQGGGPARAPAPATRTRPTRWPCPRRSIGASRSWRSSA